MQHDEFTRAAELYTGLIYRVAFGYLRSAQDAEDVSQNVLIKLYRRAGEPEPGYAWISYEATGGGPAICFGDASLKG